VGSTLIEWSEELARLEGPELDAIVEESAGKETQHSQRPLTKIGMLQREFQQSRASMNRIHRSFWRP
jgi:hypothetical protein